MKPDVMSMVVALVTASGLGWHARVSACDPEGHLDIGLEVQDDKLETGVYDLDDPQNPLLLSPGVRVWGSRFQANPLDPFFTNDPGFGAVAGSGLPGGSQIGFNVLDDLLYWDGSGDVSFGPVPDSEMLNIRFGFQSRDVGTGTGFVSGFNFDTVSGDGSVHRHLSLFLYGADGNAVPASQDGVQATDGVYLLNLEVTNTSGAVADSDPLWIVFGNFTDWDADLCLMCAALHHVGSRIAGDRPAADLDFDRDVDLDDVAAFEACATGPGVPWTDPCCQIADLDLDGDADHADFSRIQRCFSGEDTAADPDCAD